MKEGIGVGRSGKREKGIEGRAEVEERGKKEPQRSRVAENERGDANAGQTLNDFHCFQKLSYQREVSAAPVLCLPYFHQRFHLPFSTVVLRLPTNRTSPTRPFPSSNHLRHLPPLRVHPPATQLGCAVYKPYPTRNGTFSKLFPGKIRYHLLSPASI